jgi:hypothetical protein
MATCPVCKHDVATPFFLNLDAWRWLVCPRCKARLEMKQPRSVVLVSLMVPLTALAQRGRVFGVIALVFMFATIALLLLESIRPKVQLRKKLPKPTIQLNINGPSK